MTATENVNEVIYRRMVLSRQLVVLLTLYVKKFRLSNITEPTIKISELTRVKVGSTDTLYVLQHEP